LATGSALLGILIGALAGLLLGLILAYVSVTVGANQVVTGTAINLFSLGITGYLQFVLYGRNPPSSVPGLQPIDFGLLSKWPLVGEILFSHNALVYVAIALSFGLWYFFFKTDYGLVIRATGEHPLSVETAGISVAKVRYLSCAAAGALAGLGGAYLSLGQVAVFMENLTAGRGYIALAALTLGKWNPLGVIGSSMLFGAAEAVQMRLQLLGLGVPVEFLQAFPYLAAMAALSGLVGKTTPPAAVGKPFLKERGE
jgi:ABC-type uncharacterized transport system permease subunit